MEEVKNWFMCIEIKEARLKAKEIIEKLDFYDKVDLDEVVFHIEKELKCNIRTIRFDFGILEKEVKGISEAGAYVIKENNIYKIAINSIHKPEFQRFAIAHEIGHIVLSHLNETNKKLLSFLIKYDLDEIPIELCKENPYLMKEQAANAFALELLIPFDLKQIKNINELAKKYNVSIHAIEAKYRMSH